MRTTILVAVCLMALLGCDSKIEDPETDRKEMIASLRATADCLEVGRPVVKCRQLLPRKFKTEP